MGDGRWAITAVWIAMATRRHPIKSQLIVRALRFTGHLPPMLPGIVVGKKKLPRTLRSGAVSRCRRRPTLPRSLDRSTIGAAGLNARVRNGNGCGPYAPVASELETTKGKRDCGEVNRIDRSYLAKGTLVTSTWRSRIWVSQAARAIRTAALGTPCGASTCGLSTE